MANPATYANLSEAYSSNPTQYYYFATEYLIRRIGEEAAQQSNMPEVMWTEYLIGNSSLTAHFRYVDALTASTATEASALPSVAWSPEGSQVSAGLDGLAVVMSYLVDSLDGTVLSKIAEQEGTALGRKIDSSAVALFPSFGSTVGSSGQALTVATVLAANAALDANFADQIGPYVGRLHAHQFMDLYTDIMAKNFGIAKVTVDGEGREIINIGETILKKNSLLVKANSNADWAGGVFVDEAMGLAIAQNPRIEVNKIYGQNAYSIDGSVAFGVGVIRPVLGCTVISGVSA